tara:strand:+ start:34189 stop:35175 length:987 start_codon:yes stop_codon:yes gene_type:complete
MKYLVPLLFLTLVVSCKKLKGTANQESENIISNNASVNTLEHNGKKLMETKCYVCHNPNASENTRIAPPMIAVKKHYIDENTTEDEFIRAIIAWTNKPAIENSKMPGAIRRFGIMPYQSYSEKDLREIASYMYAYTIDQPEWFEEHFEQEKNRGLNTLQKTTDTQKSNEDLGLEYAIRTKQILGKNLMSTIQKKGTLAALEFCNVQAYPLTDSMANVHNAKIKRVSDKPRNPSNMANTKEIKYIEVFKNRIADGVEIKPIIDNQNGTIQFYYPITTNTMCLQCHGTSKEVSPETLATLKNLYPSDKALGYGINEVRGIWSINFQEKNE